MDETWNNVENQNLLYSNINNFVTGNFLTNNEAEFCISLISPLTHHQVRRISQIQFLIFFFIILLFTFFNRKRPFSRSCLEQYLIFWSCRPLRTLSKEVSVGIFAGLYFWDTMRPITFDYWFVLIFFHLCIDFFNKRK